MNPIDCIQLHKELDDAVVLRSALDAAMKEASATGDTAKVRELMESLQKKREAIEDKLDNRHHFALRQRLAKKIGAEYVGDFHDGLAVARLMVSSRARAIYIDRTGETIIDHNFDEAQNFSEERAIAYRDGMGYVVDTAGNVLTPAGIGAGYASDYYGGVASFRDIERELRFIDRNGKDVDYPFHLSGSAAVVGNGIVSVDRVQGVIAKEYLKFYEKEGSETKATVFDRVEFSEGMALARTPENKFHFIDESGKDIFPEGFDEAYHFSDGVALVRQGSKIFYIDKTGKNVSGKEFDTTTGTTGGFCSFRDGLARLITQDDKTIFIDKSGERAFEGEWDRAVDFSEGAALVGDTRGGLLGRSQKYYVVDKSGRRISPKFSELNEPWLNNKKNGMIRVKNGSGEKLEYFIDEAGAVIGPFIEARDFAEDFAAVKDKKGWYFIDKKGNPTTGKRFELVAGGGGGDDLRKMGLVAVVTISGRWTLVDRTGAQTTTNLYDEIGRRSDGAIIGRWAAKEFYLIGPDGRELHKEAFRFIGDFMGEVAVAQAKKGGYSVINRRGETLLENVMEWESLPRDGILRARVNDPESSVHVESYFDEKGRKVFGKTPKNS
jgi:hypothetical protein